MRRGRKRKHNPSIPAHVYQGSLPTGIYWDGSGNGRWYVREDGKAHVVAQRDARNSHLHRIIEERAGLNTNSLGWLCNLFNTSLKFKSLSARTQKDYLYQAHVTKTFQTKKGPLGELSVERLTQPVIQRLIESIAEQGFPTKANHLLRYLRRVLNWGLNRGHCTHNPARGVEEATERKQRQVPDPADMTRLIAFARLRGARTPHTEGSVAPYLWIVAELAYLCRLRGIEAITLTDGRATKEGVLTNRGKGSFDSLVRWNPRLRTAWDAAVEYRSSVTPKERPAQIDASKRFLIVNQSGEPLKKSTLDTAWQRLMLLAIKESMLLPERRFGLHAMKHRGITDTPGTRGDKQLAGGHRSERMLDVYDHSVPVVDATSD